MNPLKFLSTAKPQTKITKDCFYSLIQPIYGQTCWQIRLGYGQELCLEIGKKIPYHSPALSGEFKGEWQLGTRASDWTIYKKRHPAVRNSDSLMKSSDHEKLIKQKIAKINGQKIYEIEVIDFQEVDFSYYLFDFGLYNLIIPDQKIEDDLPLWELFMPNNQILEVYPNFEFQLHSQDEIA
ncbi:hypothetical protein H6G45_16725 [Synechocystis sp. FACHB-383]|uniref:hypothetical protein n=1 Tax=Synechocystis sp. FACHB-383 TaxID=2692864 RepID=UPI0019B281EF|nr:hypothetical protein [Synechocystis sp. FACHB-383]MBD2655100.1 hypothetical protein [Synechocystis sp. FACHB-383]